MRESISFPGLGLEFSVNRAAFSIGGLTIYWYGVIIALAFLLGILYIMKRVKEFGLDGDRAIDVILGGVLLGIVGARVYYVLFKWEDFRDNLLNIFNIRQGGIAIYGGIIGALVAGVLICRWRKVKLYPMLDLTVGGLLLGQAIGRWGNFINVEAFGSNTDLPWGMTSNSIVAYLTREQETLQALGVAVNPSQPVHPTFFYESVWCLLGFLFLAWFTGRRRYDGQMALIYLGWYGLGRFFIEGLRTDSLLVGSLRVSQILAFLCVAGSAIALIVISSRIRRANDPDYLPLYVNTDEGRAVLAGTFYEDRKKSAGEGDESPEAAQGSAGQEDGAAPEKAAEGEDEAEDAAETGAADADGQTAPRPQAAKEEDDKDGGSEDH